ncbi:hypothetical protein J4412_03065 [Candidatus Pacearchaeota archaeon]|nr:MAG: hypothetical protein QJ16_C0005G0067 [archaeon GW2011_AR1]MBS3078457.1 hypothetical protein [Candidatus Pacearchaeota archaeon]HIH52523.1 hypothetical protein [Nanoarchaeota archaeon]
MSRIKFREGEQRKFLIEVLKKLNCPTLRAFNQFGFEIPYSTWKNYFSEARLLPEELFNQICFLSKFEIQTLEIQRLENYWGQIKGGKNKKSKN